VNMVEITNAMTADTLLLRGVCVCVLCVCYCGV